MSNTSSESALSICANCGKGEEASSDLKSCAACKMVKYCSRDCQAAHRPQHKKECKKRAAELYEENLFKDHPPTKDCPICMIPLPVESQDKIFRTCCGTCICTGCHMDMYEDAKGKGKKFEEMLCAFCRSPEFRSTDELIKRVKGHMDKGNSEAITFFGTIYLQGLYGFSQDYTKANELFRQAGELGCALAYYNLAKSYENGSGVAKDYKKAKHYYEIAAMMGDVQARSCLGAHEVEDKDVDNDSFSQSARRAWKHFVVAARAGHTKSLDIVKKGFVLGHVDKEEYAGSLRAYQKRHDEMKSDARDRATPIFEDMRRRGIDYIDD